MKQLDNLFREKLENHYMEAPANAWKRIEAQSLTPNRNTIWLKIAASLLLVAAVGITTIFKLNEAPETVALFQPGKAIIPSNTSEVKAPEPTASNQTIALQENKVNTFVSANHETKLNEGTTTNVAQTHTDTPVVKTDLIIAHSENKFDNLVVEEIIEPSSTSSVVVNSTPDLTVDQTFIESTDESVTIVYAAQEVEAKFLFSVGEMDATSDAKKTSSFRKLFRKVFALKNESHGLGDLRQRKNEILALNFRNEKRERNN